MKLIRLRLLMLATVLVSGYNIVVFLLDWYKAAEPNYVEPALWLLLPQLVLTIMIVRKWPKTSNLLDWDKWKALVGLWLLIIVITAISIRLSNPSSFDNISEIGLLALATVGIPTHLFSNSANSLWSDSPSLGLFHTPWLAGDGEVVYELNYGVGFSWLLFNILFVILSLEIIASSLDPSFMPEQEAKEDVSSESDRLPESMTSLKCALCSNELKLNQKYCSGCGEPVQDKHPVTHNQEVECDQCGAELMDNQKFCGSCGVEIDWPNQVGEWTKATQVSPSISNLSGTVKHFGALGGVRRSLVIIWLIVNGLALLSLFGGQSSPDDLSKCNGLYDANVLKTYGVFRCPAIYDSNESTFDSNGFVGLIALNLIVFGCLYGYASFKNSRAK